VFGLLCPLSSDILKDAYFADLRETEDHLRDVDLDSVAEDDRLGIGRSLKLMFYDNETVLTWGAYATLVNLFRPSWIYTDDNIHLAHLWLNAVSAPPPADEHQNVLALLIDLLGNGWLQTVKIGWPEKSFMVIRAYQNKVSHNMLQSWLKQDKARSLPQQL
jgi:hypothetical protein